MTDRLEAGEFVELRDDLQCILNDPSTPPEVFDAAREADTIAKEHLGDVEGDADTSSTLDQP